jgi:tyrosyl-tRNA synthetase
MIIESEDFFNNTAPINRIQANEKNGCCKFLKIETDNPKIIDILTELKIIESKSQVKRLIEQNGITIDEGWECEQKPKDINCTVDLTLDDFFDVKIGKKKHFRIFCLTPKKVLDK